MDLPISNIAQKIDVSAVRTDSSDERVIEAVDCARKYGCYLVTVLPCQNRLLKELLQGRQTPKAGGNVGFPSGGQTTSIKVLETKELVRLGVDEIDMVMNIGFLKSGFYDRVKEDILAVKKVACGTSLKVIVESMLLNDEQLIHACKIVMDCGANYVKSGTGFSANPTTYHHVALMKKTIGNNLKLKVAGGVRNLQTLLNMYVMGANRFGIGVSSAIGIMEEALKYKDGIELPNLVDGIPPQEKQPEGLAGQQSTY